MINIRVPENEAQLKPNISVIGVGGAGGNAVNNMIQANLEGVDFLVANTDAQSLANSLTETRIQLGLQATHGLGAGSKPQVGQIAAEESVDEVMKHIDGANMVFITAGMGGGTGTGAAPVIARATRERDILTIGVITKPFTFEGTHRMRIAEAGIRELQQYVDTLIIIPNQNLFRVANEKTGFAEAFKMADNVLYSGVRGVTDLMVMPGLINLDFADIRTIMSEMGKAMMGTGEADGEGRAIRAAEAAISNPLLDDISLKGAQAMLINITGGMDIGLYEVDEAVNRVREEVDPEANVIFGSTFDTTMDGRFRVSVVATGIDGEAMVEPAPQEQPVAQPVRPAMTQVKAAQPTQPTQPVRQVAVKPVTSPVPPAQPDHFIAPQPVDPGPRPQGNGHVRPDPFAEAATRPTESKRRSSPWLGMLPGKKGPEPTVATSRPMTGQTVQPRLGFEQSTTPLPGENEDLDIPTFMRRQSN
ncbi:MAG: cell division protein FtsZ [Pseudomonadota bacterium]|nr:cell division protein FtsZ [Pseudomonadota bacterium]